MTLFLIYLVVTKSYSSPRGPRIRTHIQQSKASLCHLLAVWLGGMAVVQNRITAARAAYA